MEERARPAGRLLAAHHHAGAREAQAAASQCLRPPHHRQGPAARDPLHGQQGILPLRLAQAPQGAHAPKARAHHPRWGSVKVRARLGSGFETSPSPPLTQASRSRTPSRVTPPYARTHTPFTVFVKPHTPSGQARTAQSSADSSFGTVLYGSSALVLFASIISKVTTLKSCTAHYALRTTHYALLTTHLITHYALPTTLRRRRSSSSRPRPRHPPPAPSTSCCRWAPSACWWRSRRSSSAAAATRPSPI